MPSYYQSKFIESQDDLTDDGPVQTIEMISPISNDDSKASRLGRTICTAVKTRLRKVRQLVRRHRLRIQLTIVIDLHKRQQPDPMRSEFGEWLQRRCCALGWRLPSDNGEGPSVVPVMAGKGRLSNSSEDEMDELARLRLEEEETRGQRKLSLEETLLPYELVDSEHCETCRLTFRQRIRDGKRRAA